MSFENPFSHASRDKRKGQKAFRNCELKSVPVYIRDALMLDRARTGDRYASATLNCPTTRNQYMSPSAEAIESSNAKAAKEARSQLEELCGASVCQDCVYVGMDWGEYTDVVNQQREARTAKIVEELKAMSPLRDHEPEQPQFPPINLN